MAFLVKLLYFSKCGVAAFRVRYRVPVRHNVVIEGLGNRVLICLLLECFLVGGNQTC